MQDETRSLGSAGHKRQAHKSSGSTRYQHMLSRALALLLLVQFYPAAAPAQAPHSASASAPEANTVLAIFSDRPMSNEFWPIIVGALREELASGAPETRFLSGQTADSDPSADAPVQILRGDSIAPGLNVDNPITIYLHGDCVVPPRSFSLGQPSSSGALGWVRLNHGHIEHFIHVECTRLGQTLATQTYGLDRDQRNRLMAVAIARVILHEWIHIATQNPGHARDGLAKAVFGPQDLISERCQLTRVCNSMLVP
jgi:hypothetical protein